MDKVQLFLYFIVIILAGSIFLSQPFVYKSGESVPFIDVLFTSVSAVCVTGLSTVNMDIYTPAGFIILMILIEFGGLGIISFVSIYIIVPKRRISLVNRMVIRDFFIDDVEIEPKKILRSIIVFTISIEAICSVFLFYGFRKAGSTQPVLDAAFHAVSAFCNAGFSTYNDSLALFTQNNSIMIPMMILIVAGGIGFIVLKDVANVLFGNRHKLSLHSVVALSVSVFLIIIGAVFFLIAEQGNTLCRFDFLKRLKICLFQAITPRTAGFSTITIAQCKPISKLVMIVLMFIGGSPGSTAGGVKTTTFFITIMYVIRGNIERNGLNIRNRNIETAVIEKAFSIVAKSTIIIMVTLSLLLITEEPSLQAGSISVFDLLFETVSAFATVGLSTGVTSGLSLLGKVVIIGTMFIGRTGIAAMAMGIARNEKERFYEYPSANIMVG